MYATRRRQMCSANISTYITKEPDRFSNESTPNHDRFTSTLCCVLLPLAIFLCPTLSESSAQAEQLCTAADEPTISAACSAQLRQCLQRDQQRYQRNRRLFEAGFLRDANRLERLIRTATVTGNMPQIVRLATQSAERLWQKLHHNEVRAIVAKYRELTALIRTLEGRIEAQQRNQSLIRHYIGTLKQKRREFDTEGQQMVWSVKRASFMTDWQHGQRAMNALHAEAMANTTGDDDNRDDDELQTELVRVFNASAHAMQRIGSQYWSDRRQMLRSSAERIRAVFNAIDALV